MRDPSLDNSDESKRVPEMMCTPTLDHNHEWKGVVT